MLLLLVDDLTKMVIPKNTYSIKIIASLILNEKHRESTTNYTCNKGIVVLNKIVTLDKY